jgi:metal-responsive CopG/Arc/MetJ family transcriptional regulator
MSNLGAVNRNATKTVGTRYPLDLIPLLDSIAMRRGFTTRADLIEETLNRLVESEFPGATKRAA